jgi:hypothetical protein
MSQRWALRQHSCKPLFSEKNVFRALLTLLQAAHLMLYSNSA